MRGRFLERNSGIRIDQVPGIMPHFAAFHIHDCHGTFAALEGRHDAFLDAFLVPRLRLELVHDQLDEMRLEAVHLGHAGEVADLAVDADFGVAVAPHAVEKFAVMSFAPSDQRSEEVAFPALVAAHHQVHYLLVGVAHELLAGLRGVGPGSPGEEKAQEVVDFRDGPDSGPRIVARGLLLYGDYRTESRDFLYLRLVKHSHEVLGVRGKGVHVASLTFGVDGVEGQRRLSASAKAGDDHEFPSRDVYVHTLEIVCLGAADFYIFKRPPGRFFYIFHSDAKITISILF